jgi:hypothetical protein
VANPRQPVFTLDHNIQDRSDANLNKYKQIQVRHTTHRPALRLPLVCGVCGVRQS